MLQALSSVMCNTAFVSEGGILYTAGKFINGGVSAVIGNLGILFCVGVSMSLAKKKKADAAFVSLVSYLIWLAANSRWLSVAGLMAEGDTASALYGTGQTICLGYHVTDMGVFLGMILGVIVALVHNRFIDTEFKGAMAMYGNSKFVFIVLLPIVLVLALAAAYIWPVAAAAINALTGIMAGAGAFWSIPVWIFKPYSDPYRPPSSGMVSLPLFRNRRQYDHWRRADRRRKACFPGSSQRPCCCFHARLCPILNLWTYEDLWRHRCCSGFHRYCQKREKAATRLRLSRPHLLPL